MVDPGPDNFDHEGLLKHALANVALFFGDLEPFLQRGEPTHQFWPVDCEHDLTESVYVEEKDLPM